MDTVLTWILSGFLAGWIVRFVMGSRRDFGVTGDLILGSLGGLVGGWLLKHLGLTTPNGRLVHVFVAVTGAATLVGALRIVRATVVAGVSALPASPGLDVDLDKQVRLLSDLERRVLTRMLRRRPGADDPNRVFDAKLTFGQRVADRVATFGGSWTFIIFFSVVLFLWVTVNSFILANRAFDPYPYILMNLVLSALAALQAPVIMMSQNRSEARDRLRGENDYKINLKAELEIRHLHEKLDHLLRRQYNRLFELQQIQIELLEELGQKRRGSTPAASAPPASV